MRRGSSKEARRSQRRLRALNAATGDHARASAQASGTRYSGGPEEGSRGLGR
jgi:hypothetical protein